MNTVYLKRLRMLFPNNTPQSRHNARAWVKSVRHLGDKWLLAKPVLKLSK